MAINDLKNLFMKALKIIVAAIAMIVIAVVLFAWYIGYFNSVKVEEKNIGGYTVAGIEFKGPYSQTGKFMAEVNEKFKNAGFECQKGFGIYYDDPKIVPEEKCRSFVGCIIEEKSIGRIHELKSVGFRIDSIPLAPAVVAEFPIKNSFSYMVGPMKVYPVLSTYVKEKNLKCALSVEVYDMPKKKIIYIMQY